MNNEFVTFAFVIGLILGMSAGAIFGYKKGYSEKTSEVEERFEEEFRRQREAMIKREQEAKGKEESSVVRTEITPTLVDDPSWHLEEEGESIFCIDRATYEGTSESAFDYYFDKVDVAYSISSGKLFENFSQGENSVKCYYKDEKLCSFLADGPEEPDSEGYIYVRDLLHNIDYRVKMEEAIEDITEEKKEE